MLCLGADEPRAAAPKSVGVTIYDADPQNLWNRLHQAICVRTIDGVDYGVDSPVPFFGDADNLLTGEANARLLAVLDEVAGAPADRLPGALTRALLQHDAWAAFDQTLYGGINPLTAQRKALRARLAKVIALLAIKDDEIARLPDNYTDAVKSGAFAADFDPAKPEQTFLPPDLFDRKGPWVELSDDNGRSVAPTHVESLGARSAFSILIPCPGARKETLAYMEKLNLYTTPWALEPAPIATRYPDGGKVRWDPLRQDKNTPQFPAGTMFALVRQMTVVDDQLELRPTRITQSVQFRVYRHVGEGFRVKEGEEAKALAFFELNKRRGDLLAGRTGGLHAVAKGDIEPQLFPIGGRDNGRASRLRGSDGLAACTTCHTGNGIFSVNTYRRGTNPQLFAAPNAGHSVERSILRKRERSDWGMLRGLVEAGESTR
jgi:hypothetical protein